MFSVTRGKMQTNSPVFLLVLIAASCFSTGSEASSVSVDIVSGLEAIEKIGQDVTECLAVTTSHVTDLLKSLPPDLLQHVTQNLLPDVLETISPSAPVAMLSSTLSTVPPELIVKVGSVLNSLLSQIGDVLNMVLERAKEAVPLGNSDSSRYYREALGISRKRREQSPGLLGSLLSFPLNTLQDLLGNVFNLLCNTGGTLITSLLGKPVNFNCNSIAKMLKGNPEEILTTVVLYVTNDTSNIVQDILAKVGKTLWTFLKTTLFPLLYTVMNKLKDSGQLPPSVSSVVGTIDMLYDTLRILGVL